VTTVDLLVGSRGHFPTPILHTQSGWSADSSRRLTQWRS